MVNNTTELKTVAIISYAPFVAMCSYLGLDETAMSILAILMVSDLVTGLLKAIVKDSKPSFKRFYNGLISKVVLMLVPLLFALVVRALDEKFEPMIYTIITILILSEFYSNLSNIYTIRTGKDVVEFDPVAMLLKIIQKRLNKAMGDIE